MRKNCMHQFDYDALGIASLWEDVWVAVRCRHCGEHGFAVIDPEDLYWNDEDDPPEDGGSQPRVGTNTLKNSSK